MSTEGVQPPIPDWVEGCDSETEGQCTSHFPAVLDNDDEDYDSAGPNQRQWDPKFKHAWKHKNAKAKLPPVLRPSFKNPYTTYHYQNRNSKRCLTSQSFSLRIAPHIGSHTKTSSLEEVEERMRAILEQLVICRNSQSVYIDTDGKTKKCGADLPAMIELRQKIISLPAEYKNRLRVICAS
ncbi:hypothetical protein B0A50_04811 [Salinomyces thailandicus]|uniref:Uncharacterized protein n=1 Tax=Salinomyces thailandicus TaxID=706561 RepID=A0A4U0TYT7_9PEZI|nr:hypothetical protein B0A50_04811 [Salinomyces thailandica]